MGIKLKNIFSNLTQLKQKGLPMSRKNGMYGYFVGMTTAATLQPLDNIKMALIVPPDRLSLSSNFLKNIYLASKYIMAEEGWRSFYKGLVVNVWKSGMSSAVFFYLLRTIQDLMPQTSVTHFTASAAARVASAVVANPLSIIEARYEISGKEKWEGSIMQSIRKIYMVEGIQGFFKGCAASCYKEASFAGLYYTLYEKGKQLQLSPVVAGMGAGMISTLTTHPFEIIRTQIQVYINFHANEKNHKEEPIFRQLASLMRDGKVFDGVAPRLIKKPMANTLAFLLFEHLENKNNDILV